MAKKKETITGTQAVDEYMAALEHPFKAEVEALRQIILEANPKMHERVKWNSPSFYYQVDLAAFHLRETKRVHIVFVFYKGQMIHESNGILEGDYKDRRMAYFYSMEDVLAKKEALQKIVNDWIELIETA